MLLLERIAAKHLIGDAIGDPKKLLESLRFRQESYFFTAKNDSHLIRRVVEELKRAKEHRNIDSEAYDVKREAERALAYKIKNVYRLVHGEGHYLFLALLQQYQLPPKIRKGVEAAAKFYNKSSLRVPLPKAHRVYGEPYGPEDLRVAEGILDAYDDLVKVFEQHLEVAGEALAQGRLLSEVSVEEEGSSKVNAGPFTLINTSGFKPEVMAEAAKVVQEAAKRMTEHGMGKVCYGDIMVSKSIHNGNVLAFYLTAKDEMFVRAGMRRSVDTVRTVCHELAHRLQFKFLKGKDHEIHNLYRAMNGDPEIHPEDIPQPGEVIVEGKRTFVVIRYNPVSKKVELQSQDNPRMTGSIPIMGWLRGKGHDVLSRPGFKGFVTNYAKKDPTENFAELVSFYCLDKLPPDYKVLLEGVLK